MFGLKKPRVATHPLGERDLKDFARRLQTLLPVPAGDAPLRLSLDECQDIIARLHHHNSWAEVEQQGTRLQIDPLAPALLMAKNEASLDERAYLPLGHQFVRGTSRHKSPVWAQTVTQALDQTLVLGSTGAGKTETLLSMGVAALKQGSGLVYFDGKGDHSLFTRMFAMAQASDRLNHLFVVNLMTLGRSTSEFAGARVSNTLNPMEAWGADDLLAWCDTWLTHGLVAPDDRDRVRHLLSEVLGLLVWGRDERLWALDVHRLSQAMAFDGLLALLNDERLTPGKRAPLQHALDAMLGNGPAEPFWAHVEQARARHAAVMQPLVNRCNDLTRAYGHVFNAQVNAETGEWLSSEIDLDAVLDERQMLLCLLPALEKSIDEMATLGRVVLGGVQVAIARRARRLASTRVERVNTMMIVDEAGYFMLPTVDDLVLNAPKAGVACVWGSQDLPALVQPSGNHPQDQAQKLADSCGTTLFMKLEDPTMTYDFYERLAFREKLPKTLGDESPALIQARPRGRWLDLKDQHAGQAVAVTNGHALPLTMMYVQLKKPDKVWLNRPALTYLGKVQDRPPLVPLVG